LQKMLVFEKTDDIKKMSFNINPIKKMKKI
jgi:hypothetical protein